MRGWILAGLGVAALAACSMVTPPPPAGTVLLQLKVSNASANPATLAVELPGGVLDGAVEPPTLPARSEADVAFHVPISGSWMITVNGRDLLLSTDMRGRVGVIDDIGIDVGPDGMVTFWCRELCP